MALPTETQELTTNSINSISVIQVHTLLQMLGLNADQAFAEVLLESFKVLSKKGNEFSIGDLSKIKTDVIIKYGREN